MNKTLSDLSTMWGISKGAVYRRAERANVRPNLAGEFSKDSIQKMESTIKTRGRPWGAKDSTPRVRKKKNTIT